MRRYSYIEYKHPLFNFFHHRRFATDPAAGTGGGGGGGTDPVKPGDKAPEKVEDQGFKELKEQRDSLKTTLRTQTEELASLRTYKAEQDRLAKEASDKELAKRGEYEKIIENNKKEGEAKQTALINRMAISAIPLLIKGAAAKVSNLTPNAIADLPDLLDKYLALDADNFSIKVLNPDGTPMLDQKTGKAIDPDEFVQSFIKDRPYLLSDALPVKHGLIPPNRGPAKTGVMEMSEEETKAAIAADPRAYNEALAQEFTHANMVHRARALLQEKGIMVARPGAAK